MKKHTYEIRSLVINTILEKLTESIIPQLSSRIMDALFTKIDIIENKSSVEQLEFQFSLKPYVEYIKKVQAIEVASVKINFQIDSIVTMNNIIIQRSDSTVEVNIGNLTGALNLSIISTRTSVSGRGATSTFGSPILLCKNQPYNVGLNFELSPYVK